MKQGETIRILVPGDDLDVEAIRTGIGLAVQMADSPDYDIDSIFIYTPVKQHLLHSSLSEALGEQESNALYKGKPFTSHGGSQISLITDKTFRRGSGSTGIVVVYADQKMMDKVDGAKDSFKAIIALPYADGVLDGWKKSWSPIIFGEKEQNEETITDQLIVSALKSLTNSINLSNNSLNPRDKEHTENVVRILISRRHIEDSKNIKSWVIGNGWNPKAGTELQKIWERISNLSSSPRVKDKKIAERLYEHWVKNM